MTVQGLIDYHLHTSTSTDAHSTVDEYCARAAKLGLAEIAITNHMNLQEDRYHLTPAVMAEVWSEIQACQPKYPDLTIRLGIEVDYFDDLHDEIAQALPKYAEAIGRPLDFVMGSAHEMDGVRFASRKQAHKLLVGADPIPIYEKFFELMTGVVTSGLFDIVAHPDLIRRFTGLHSPFVPFEEYKEAANAFIATLVENDVGFEINVKGLVHPVEDMYPTKEFLVSYLKQCKSAGRAPILVIGTDAHYPDHLGTNLDVAAQRLRQLGVSEITTFSQGKRIPFQLPELIG
ncbi:histidinol-phosphatase HisJ family protein [Candidatus Bipolaricaulota bacterium]|nr:histidinol-phosphatase HisJ family protein [Candidatus Bipolaricaulota bacterium]